jgi:hypothetical protein
MEIAIHGTKGGYHIFTPKSLKGLFDARPDTSNVHAIGQEAYSIHFFDCFYIFSKYKIIRDVPGDKRTGNIAFSLYLSNKEKLSGKEVNLLLDRISNEYCSKYISGNNLDNIHEDWKFIENISNEYTDKLNLNDEELQSGTKDAAFIYYASGEELQKYFDEPFQIEEYREFKQIFFVKEEFVKEKLRNNPENPLNALRHSGSNLTGKIDLGNKYYYLKNYDGSKKVTITAEGRPRSGKKNEDYIRANWLIKIKYEKPYYEPIEIEGTLSELEKYLTVEGKHITINYGAFHPTPKTKTIGVKIKDYKGNSVTDAEIYRVNHAGQSCREFGTQISFQGEEIGKNWQIWAKKDEDCSVPISVTPDKQNSPVVLTLPKQKVPGWKDFLKKYKVLVSLALIGMGLIIIIIIAMGLRILFLQNTKKTSEPGTEMTEQVERAATTNSGAKTSLSSEQNSSQPDQDNHKVSQSTSTPEKTPQPQPRHRSSANPDSQNDEITQYLQGDKLNKDKLEQYKKNSNSPQKKSIELVLEFWELIKNSDNTFRDLLREIKKDTILKSSKLCDFLSEQQKDNFSRLQELPGKELLNTLQDLKNKLNQ